MKKNGFVQEFKEFISRGNVVDLAVGMIMGSAFTAIVNSLVNDMVMPTIGMIIGNNSFENFKYVIAPAVGDNPESAIYYGTFIQNIVNFLVIALVIFLMVKGINALRRKPDPEPAAEEPKAPTEVEINNELLKENTAVLKEIRDAMKKK